MPTTLLVVAAGSSAMGQTPVAPTGQMGGVPSISTPLPQKLKFSDRRRGTLSVAPDEPEMKTRSLRDVDTGGKKAAGQSSHE
jgi:hypothetical protein